MNQLQAAQTVNLIATIISVFIFFDSDNKLIKSLADAGAFGNTLIFFYIGGM